MPPDKSDWSPVCAHTRVGACVNPSEHAVCPCVRMYSVHTHVGEGLWDFRVTRTGV